MNRIKINNQLAVRRGQGTREKMILTPSKITCQHSFILRRVSETMSQVRESIRYTQLNG